MSESRLFEGTQFEIFFLEDVPVLCLLIIEVLYKIDVKISFLPLLVSDGSFLFSFDLSEELVLWIEAYLYCFEVSFSAAIVIYGFATGQLA